MLNMKPVKDAAPCFDQMAIVEKYEKVIAYLYPIAQMDAATNSAAGKYNADVVNQILGQLPTSSGVYPLVMKIQQQVESQQQKDDVKSD